MASLSVSIRERETAGSPGESVTVAVTGEMDIELIGPARRFRITS